LSDDFIEFLCKLLVLPYPNYYIYLQKNYAIPVSAVSSSQINLDKEEPAIYREIQ